MDQINNLSEALPDANNVVIHVEVCQKSTSSVKSAVLQERVQMYLVQQTQIFDDMTLSEFEDKFLKEHILYIKISDNEANSNNKVLDMGKSYYHIYLYQLNEDGPASEEVQEEGLSAANHWLLPQAEFEGLWENLVFDSSIKAQLLHYAVTTLLFSDKNVNSNIIAWNRVILLHGPPGTGKTSLCKALAQKLTIRLANRYKYGQLIEINSHSLFSKWFSESGKLVMKMFQKIQELIDDSDALVCVLIDEVESLTAARKSAMSGNEPSDAIRVVNALLTQIDQIKRHPNVIILTTSNVTGAIDLAFVDRADIKQYIGPPSSEAIYIIYLSCLNELMRTGIIQPAERLYTWREVKLMKFTDNEGHCRVTGLSLQLIQLSEKSNGLSGRTLRKLPFLAHALFVQSTTVSLVGFLEALSLAIDQQFQDRRDLCNDN